MVRRSTRTVKKTESTSVVDDSLVAETSALFTANRDGVWRVLKAAAAVDDDDDDDDDRKTVVNTALRDMMNSNRTKSSSFSFDSFFDALTQKRYNELWNLVLTRVAFLVKHERFIALEDESDTQTVVNACAEIDVFVVMALSFIAKPTRQHPPAFLTLCKLLHDQLFSFQTQDGMRVQNHISKLCETMWRIKASICHEIISQIILYLLVRCLQASATASDIKRLYDVRESFALIDFEDKDSETLKHLCLRCAIHPLFLRNEKGRSFISFLIGTHESIIDILHAAVATQLPLCTKTTLLNAFGTVYFKAWLTMTPASRISFELNVVQDLMVAGIHAKIPQTFTAVRRVLTQFTMHKHIRGVDEMLNRLYEPIIWRSLTAANAVVRLQSLCLWTDAFPLHDPDEMVYSTEEKLQKQYEELFRLLQDVDVAVRKQAILSVTKILNLFWELIPQDFKISYLDTLVSKLAFDASSSSVRVAVCRGLSSMLNNHLCHSTMKELLPKIGNMLHDTSESVRVAFTDLLLVVRGLRLIRSFDICPLALMLRRLAIDSDKVSKKLTNLLLDSFFPVNKPVTIQLSRCIALLRFDGEAANRFFSIVHTLVPIACVCKVIEALYRCVCSFLHTEYAGKENQRRTRQSNDIVTRRKRTKCAVKEVSKIDTCSVLRDDVTLIEAMLSAMAHLWCSVSSALQNDDEKELLSCMHEIFADTRLQDIMKIFTSSSTRKCVMAVMSQLPFSCSPCIYEEGIKLLCEMSIRGFEHDFAAPLLECLFAWGRYTEVITLLLNGITHTLVDEKTNKKIHTNMVKKMRKNSVIMDGYCAVKCLDLLFEISTTRLILVRELKSNSELKQSLEPAFTFLQREITKEEASSRLTFVLQCWKILCKVHIHSMKSDEQIIPEFLVTVYDWASAFVVPMLHNTIIDIELPPFSVIMFLSRLACELIMLGVFSTHCPAPQIASWLHRDQLGQELQRVIFKILYQFAQQKTVVFDDTRELLTAALMCVSNKHDIVHSRANIVLQAMMKRYADSVDIIVMVILTAQHNMHNTIWIENSTQIHTGLCSLLECITRSREAILSLEHAVTQATDGTMSTAWKIAHCLCVLKLIPIKTDPEQYQQCLKSAFKRLEESIDNVSDADTDQSKSDLRQRLSQIV